MTHWTLQGSAPCTAQRWPELVDDLQGWQAAWADLAGMHITSALPADPPVGTHLWAWHDNAFARIRIDGATWWASVLHRATPRPQTLWQADPEHIPHLIVDRIRSWSPTDGRVAQMRLASGTLIPDEMVQLVPIRARPVAYIATPDAYSP